MDKEEGVNVFSMAPPPTTLTEEGKKGGRKGRRRIQGFFSISALGYKTGW
jgi:hypothetical protein